MRPENSLMEPSLDLLLRMEGPRLDFNCPTCSKVHLIIIIFYARKVDSRSIFISHHKYINKIRGAVPQTQPAEYWTFLFPVNELSSRSFDQKMIEVPFTFMN